MQKDFSQKNFFFQKNTLCHSFHISVIPSVLLSFLPYYCHSFRILSFLPNYHHFKIFVILNSSCPLPYPKGEKNGHRRWPYMRVYLILYFSIVWKTVKQVIISNPVISLVPKKMKEIRIEWMIALDWFEIVPYWFMKSTQCQIGPIFFPLHYFHSFRDGLGD